MKQEVPFVHSPQLEVQARQVNVPESGYVVAGQLLTQIP